MIRYALICSDCEAEFEAWFQSSAGYDDQKKRGLIECAACSSKNVSKAIMAPSVKRTDTARSTKDGKAAMKTFISHAKRHIAENFDYVGDKFADEARAIHEGSSEERPIWGQTTPEESAALEDDGIEALPLPEPLTPEIPKDDTELN